MLAATRSIPRQKSFVLFSCSSWHSLLDKGWVFSFTNFYGMHKMILAHLSLFWVAYHPSRIFPQNSLSGNPRIDFPLLPTARSYSLLLLIHGPSPLYWLGTNGWWLSLVRAPLPCVSMAYLLFTCLPLPVGLYGLYCTFCSLFLTLCGVNESLGLHLCISFLSWIGFCLGMGPSSFNSTSVSLYF